jgi:hypothetical protein
MTAYRINKDRVRGSCDREQDHRACEDRRAQSRSPVRASFEGHSSRGSAGAPTNAHSRKRDRPHGTSERIGPTPHKGGSTCEAGPTAGAAGFCGALAPRPPAHAGRAVNRHKRRSAPPCGGPHRPRAAKAARKTFALAVGSPRGAMTLVPAASCRCYAVTFRLDRSAPRPCRKRAEKIHSAACGCCAIALAIDTRAGTTPNSACADTSPRPCRVSSSAPWRFLRSD